MDYTLCCNSDSFYASWGMEMGGIQKNIWCGIYASAVHLIIDTERLTLGFYKIVNPVISVWGAYAAGIMVIAVTLFIYGNLIKKKDF